MERDLIEEYLAQLRAGLLTSPRQAQLILDEAEDHLRESVAAGLAAGQTELEAQQAAIASFGSVRAVVRAHAAGRHGRVFAAVADVVLGTWKLLAVYLLADVLAWQAYQLLAAPVGHLIGDVPVGNLVAVCIKGCNRISPSQRRVVASDLMYPTSLLWIYAGAIGLALLAVFAFIRFWQRRHGRVRPMLLGSYSPAPGAIIFLGFAALIVYALARSGARWYYEPDVMVALIAAVVTAVGYLVALARALRRRPRPVVVAA
jgi:HAAS domain-containing protein